MTPNEARRKLIDALNRSEGGVDRFMDIGVKMATDSTFEVPKSMTTAWNKVLDGLTKEERDQASVNVGVQVVFPGRELPK